MYQGFSIQSSLNFEGFGQIQIVIIERILIILIFATKNSKRKTEFLNFDLIKK